MRMAGVGRVCRACGILVPTASIRDQFARPIPGHGDGGLYNIAVQYRACLNVGVARVMMRSICDVGLNFQSMKLGSRGRGRRSSVISGTSDGELHRREKMLK